MIVTAVIKALALTSWLLSSRENSVSVIQAGLVNAATEVNIMPQICDFIYTQCIS